MSAQPEFCECGHHRAEHVWHWGPELAYCVVTAPTWRATAYPVTTVCPFCGNTLTIALRGDGPTTVTTGHAHDCIQNPNRQRAAKGSAA